MKNTVRGRQKRTWGEFSGERTGFEINQAWLKFHLLNLIVLRAGEGFIFNQSELDFFMYKTGKYQNGLHLIGLGFMRKCLYRACLNQWQLVSCLWHGVGLSCRNPRPVSASSVLNFEKPLVPYI